MYTYKESHTQVSEFYTMNTHKESHTQVSEIYTMYTHKESHTQVSEFYTITTSRVSGFNILDASHLHYISLKKWLLPHWILINNPILR